MKIDWKKAKSVFLTYASLTLPLALAAYGLDAPTIVKVLTFISGLLAIITRQINPKDTFEIALLTALQDAVKKELAKRNK